MDFRACRWPSHLDPLKHDTALAQHLDAMNDSPRMACSQDRNTSSKNIKVVITFSHFLPRYGKVAFGIQMLHLAIPSILPKSTDAFIQRFPALCGEAYVPLFLFKYSVCFPSIQVRLWPCSPGCRAIQVHLFGLKCACLDR